MYLATPLRPNKKICVFQVTWNFKIGMEGWKNIFILLSVYMRLIGKQYGQTGKSSKKTLKNLRVGGQKLDTVG